MKYMGSKARIVHEILPIMLDKEHNAAPVDWAAGWQRNDIRKIR